MSAADEFNEGEAICMLFEEGRFSLPFMLPDQEATLFVGWLNERARQVLADWLATIDYPHSDADRLRAALRGGAKS